MSVDRIQKVIGSVLLMGMLCLSAPQSESQSNPGIRVHMHGIEGYAADGLLYSPAATERAAALLLIPDERGITRRISDAAVSFLGAGYLVVVVDLNRGLAPDMATRTAPEVAHDLHAALAFVYAQAHVNHDNVGLVGWGSGGADALRLAGDTALRAVAIEDSAPAPAYADIAASRTAVLASFAASTADSSAARTTDSSLLPAEALAARLHVLAKTADVKVYTDAERGFDDPEDSVHFKPSELTDIRSREMKFFADNLNYGSAF